MNNIVFYFSGTGNSLLVAKTLAQEWGSGDIVAMAPGKKYTFTKQYDTIGFVYPTYYWGLPRAVKEFISNLDDSNKNAYYYAIATYGGIAGNNLSQTMELLREKGIALQYGRKLRMPANYIIAYNAGKNPDKLLKRANKKLLSIIAGIKNRKTNTIKRSNKYMKKLYDKSMLNISSLANDFNVNQNCIGCGICKEVCPVSNIEMINNKPEYRRHCEQCLACMHYCPRQAINYKNITQNRRRYTNPSIPYQELAVHNKR